MGKKNMRSSDKKAIMDPPSLLGRWSLGKKIGSGAFSSIYDATDSKSQILGSWAIKVSKSSVDMFDRSRKTLTERSIAGALNNERHMYDVLAYAGSSKRSDFPLTPKEDWFGKEVGWAYLVMDKINGKSLKELSPAETGKPVDPTWLRSTALALVHALEFLHSTFHVHADIKPANIIIREDTRKPVLVDFGISATMTYIEKVKDTGTLDFMSRVIHHGAFPSKFDDLESLMYTLVWVYRGKLPWSGLKKGPEIAAMKKKFTCGGDLPVGFSEVWELIAEPADRRKDPDYEAIRALLGEESEKKSRKRAREASDGDGSPPRVSRSQRPPPHQRKRRLDS